MFASRYTNHRIGFPSRKIEALGRKSRRVVKASPNYCTKFAKCQTRERKIPPWYYIGAENASCITEKATKVSEKNQFVFKVKIDSNKKEIKKAIEKLFKVKVKNVKTIKIKGKNKVFKGTKGRRADYKKAIICLNKGENLDYSGGISWCL